MFSLQDQDQDQDLDQARVPLKQFMRNIVFKPQVITSKSENYRGCPVESYFTTKNNKVKTEIFLDFFSFIQYNTETMKEDPSTKKAPKPFPWTCPRCIKQEVFPGIIDEYRVNVKDKDQIVVRNLNISKCRLCGEIIFTNDTGDQIDCAIQKEEQNDKKR